MAATCGRIRFHGKFFISVYADGKPKASALDVKKIMKDMG